MIEIRWQYPGSKVRPGFVLALALVLHLGMILWWHIERQADLATVVPLKIRLLPTAPDRGALQAPEQAPPPREPEVVPVESPMLQAVTVASPPPVVQTRMEPQAQVESLPNAARLLGSLGKYRLNDDQLDLFAAQGPQIRVLGEPPPGDVMLALQDRIPDLPFGSSGLQLAFYSSGARGDLERFGDAITREFGFQTRYGTRVKCVFMVVLLACGWD